MRSVPATTLLAALTAAVIGHGGCTSPMVASGMDPPDASSEALHGSYVVDAREDAGWVRLEDGSARVLHVPSAWLPAQAREGDVLTVRACPTDDGSGRRVVFRIDREATEARRRAIEERHGRLPRAPGGDITL